MLPSRAGVCVSLPIFLLLFLPLPAVSFGAQLKYFGNAENAFDVTDPVGSAWDELYPEFRGGPYLILDWRDAGDGLLDFPDTVRMSEPDSSCSCHGVVDVTMTLKVKLAASSSVICFWNWDQMQGGQPLVQPVCTWWNEVHPEFGTAHHIIGWCDNGSAGLDSSDVITVDGAGEYLIVGIRTGLVTEPINECATDVATWGKIKSLYR